MKCVILFATVAAVWLQDISAAAPDSIIQTVTNDGETYTLCMQRETVRSQNFEVLVQGNTGDYTPYDAGEIRTYLGEVEELPDAVAAGILRSDDRLETIIYLDRGLYWTTMARSVIRTGGERSPEYAFPGSNTAGTAYVSDENAVFAWGLALDASYKYYSLHDGIDELIEEVEFNICKVKAIYVRDVMMMPAIGRFIIRTSPDHCPYDEYSSVFDLLPPLRDEWRDNQSDAERFITSVIFTGGGGIAYYPGIWSAHGSGNSGAFDAVARHEFGHNWNTNDYHAGSPEGRTIMCGNSSTRFNGMSAGAILRRRDDNAEQLDNLGFFSKLQVPPYAALDVREVRSSMTSMAIDVLENDHDANGDALSLESFDETSENGGSLFRSPGTGADGRDEIVYTQPETGGLDYFHYQVSDATGKIATGLVLIDYTAPIVALNAEPVLGGNRILSFGTDTYIVDVKTGGIYTIELFSLAGRVIDSYTGSGPERKMIPVPKASGVCLLRLITGDGMIIRKMIAADN
jgi:hypothetical protein